MWETWALKAKVGYSNQRALVKLSSKLTIMPFDFFSRLSTVHGSIPSKTGLGTFSEKHLIIKASILLKA
ncbi:hypothetical protein IX84_19465 [Phaeodactylibacter xiamenensis]|uniref:Uncharacterized protein n=1 Tax=Phaeodactylibacter xiamenensis TaxID=1524460 RepID=A0A098S3E3_9BACT|nr:hypothetical protein IX84_19465 [Phaeodactylibacter xiamenensis]